MSDALDEECLTWACKKEHAGIQIAQDAFFSLLFQKGHAVGSQINEKASLLAMGDLQALLGPGLEGWSPWPYLSFW